MPATLRGMSREPDTASRAEMIRWLLGEPGELPGELQAAGAAAFATATDAELRELVGMALEGGTGLERAQELGELSGRRRLELQSRHGRG